MTALLVTLVLLKIVKSATHTVRSAPSLVLMLSTVYNAKVATLSPTGSAFLFVRAHSQKLLSVSLLPPLSVLLRIVKIASMEALLDVVNAVRDIIDFLKECACLKNAPVGSILTKI